MEPAAACILYVPRVPLGHPSRLVRMASLLTNRTCEVQAARGPKLTKRERRRERQQQESKKADKSAAAQPACKVRPCPAGARSLAACPLGCMQVLVVVPLFALQSSLPKYAYKATCLVLNKQSRRSRPRMRQQQQQLQHHHRLVLVQSHQHRHSHHHPRQLPPAQPRSLRQPRWGSLCRLSHAASVVQGGSCFCSTNRQTAAPKSKAASSL